MALVRWGGVICLAAFIFGSVCFTVVATMGEGEDPPKIFEQMGAFSCGLFSAGLIVGVIGWLISLNQPEPPKPTAASAGIKFDDEEDDAPEAVEESEADKPSKPDPYASKHRRKGI